MLLMRGRALQLRLGTVLLLPIVSIRLGKMGLEAALILITKTYLKLMITCAVHILTLLK